MKLSIDELYLILQSRFENGVYNSPQSYKDIIDACDALSSEAKEILKTLENQNDK